MQLGFIAVLALLLIVGAVAYRSVTASTDSARWVQHSSEVLEHLAHLRAAVETIDSGYRDFALSGDDAFLQLSRGRISLVDQEQSTLLTLTADNLPQQHRLAVIAAATRRIIQRGDAMIQLRRADGAEPVVRVPLRCGRDGGGGAPAVA
jgi:CHASE3 domain sensor protein